MAGGQPDLAARRRAPATLRRVPDRRERLRSARLYLVCDEQSDEFLEAVLRRRRRHSPAADEGRTGWPDRRRRAAIRPRCVSPRRAVHLNDRPDLVDAVGADGVHVGQDDVTVADARAAIGPDRLVGLSTHSPEQVDAAARLPSTTSGWGRYTRRRPNLAARPWGWPSCATPPTTRPCRSSRSAGSRPANAGAVREAGAEWIAVVRAMTDAEDPAAAARGLRAAFGAPADGGEVRVGAAR